MPAKGVPGRIRIGVGGWTYEPWRGTFYPGDLPQKRELEYASRQLTSIEINGTYYGSQKPATFAKWRDETPDDFVFSVKAPRYAMNRNVLAEAGGTIERFLAGGVMELKDKLGAINWQFLPTKQFEPADFEAFLKLLPPEAAGRALRHVVEVRHDSFLTPDFVALVNTYGVGVVIAGVWAYRSHQATLRADLLAKAMQIDDAAIGPPQPPRLNFTTPEDKEKARIAAFTEVATKYPGSAEGAMAQLAVAAAQADEGHIDADPL